MTTPVLDRNVEGQLKEHLLAIKALLTSMDSSVLSEAADNVWKYNSYKIYMRKYNDLVTAVCKVLPVQAVIDVFLLDKVPGCNDTIASQQKEYFDSVHANLSILKAYLEAKLDLKEDRITSLTNFFQVNLRKAVYSEPTAEVEVQNAIETLMIGRGMRKGTDYDREVGRVKMSIKELIPDFIVPGLGLAIEAKLSKDKQKSKAIVDEINADIAAYRKKYSSVLFIVYDLSTIRDELEFKVDLENAAGVSVIVVKH